MASDLQRSALFIARNAAGFFEAKQAMHVGKGLLFEPLMSMSTFTHGGIQSRPSQLHAAPTVSGRYWTPTNTTSILHDVHGLPLPTIVWGSDAVDARLRLEGLDPQKVKEAMPSMVKECLLEQLHGCQLRPVTAGPPRVQAYKGFALPALPWASSPETALMYAIIAFTRFGYDWKEWPRLLVQRSPMASCDIPSSKEDVQQNPGEVIMLTNGELDLQAVSSLEQLDVEHLLEVALMQPAVATVVADIGQNNIFTTLPELAKSTFESILRHGGFFRIPGRRGAQLRLTTGRVMKAAPDMAQAAALATISLGPARAANWTEVIQTSPDRPPPSGTQDSTAARAPDNIEYIMRHLKYMRSNRTNKVLLHACQKAKPYCFHGPGHKTLRELAERLHTEQFVNNARWSERSAHRDLACECQTPCDGWPLHCPPIVEDMKFIPNAETGSNVNVITNSKRDNSGSSSSSSSSSSGSSDEEEYDIHPGDDGSSLPTSVPAVLPQIAGAALTEAEMETSLEFIARNALIRGANASQCLASKGMIYPCTPGTGLHIRKPGHSNLERLASRISVDALQCNRPWTSLYAQRPSPCTCTDPCDARQQCVSSDGNGTTVGRSDNEAAQGSHSGAK